MNAATLEQAASFSQLGFVARSEAKWTQVSLPDLGWNITEPLHQHLDQLRTDPSLRFLLEGLSEKSTSPEDAQRQIDQVNAAVMKWQTTFLPSHVTHVVLDHCYNMSMPEEDECKTLIKVSGSNQRVSYWTVLCALDAFYRQNRQLLFWTHTDGTEYSVDHVYFEGFLECAHPQSPHVLYIQPNIGS